MPSYPPVDLSYIEKEISGNTFTETNEVVSTPTGSSTSTRFSNLASISGTLREFSCVDISAGVGPSTYFFPQPVDNPVTFEWDSRHTAGSTYPAELHETTSKYWS